MKVIVVVDIPDDLNIGEYEANVKIDQWRVDEFPDLTKPRQLVYGWQKLKPMPQKYCTDGGDDIEENSYWQGWNECIEELEK